jgi:undecaprenyl-diphosphatase
MCVAGLTYGRAIILGLVQGLTEFLPVSSSGHLVLARQLVGLSVSGLHLEILLHLGTALAVVVLLWPDWLGLALSLLRGRRGGTGLGLALRLLVATVPAGIVGFLLGRLVAERLAQPRAAAGFLLVTALVLFVADRIKPGSTAAADLPLARAFLVGIAQAVAIIPGISRSGTTVAAGIATGLRRDEAARFSLMLSVPVIAGGVAADLLALGPAATSAGGAQLAMGPLLAGLASAFVSGLVAASILLAVVRRARLGWFAVYCAVAGAAALGLLARG